MLSALCYASESSAEFRKEEDGQPLDIERLERTQSDKRRFANDLLNLLQQG
jgi:hypothetical protein